MDRCKKILLYTDIIRLLGIRNVAYVAWYRFSLKIGIRKRLFPQKVFFVDSNFFHQTPAGTDYPLNWKKSLFDDADKICQGWLRYYGFHWKNVGSPPNWFLNPFKKACYPDPQGNWTDLADFHPAAGDIKNIWEASRLESVVTLARAFRASGDSRYLDTLNQWLAEWCDKNPLNTGPNWKCGQEASIRIFNLVLAAMVLQQWQQPSPALAEFIFRHLERIHGNIRYAIAQDNNHGTSEAAALFIAGSWLAKASGDKKVARKSAFYARSGRKWLENRVGKLIEADGSFSQHSVTYHRVLLDTLIFSEQWRRTLDAAPFTDLYYARATAALDWLAALTDCASGGAPNLGANDGAMLLHMHGCDYRDFRPTLQTASVLFRARKLFDAGPWDEPLFWLGIDARPVKQAGPKKQNKVFPGGYVTMAGQNSWALLRFPMYRFRPSHNDVFHFDLWYKGENICRDAGSFSYNPDQPSDDHYFKSVQAHNTVSFDGQEQMPRLGRFMLAKWIKAERIGAVKTLKDGGHSWTGSYTDHRGNRHQRSVIWKNDTWIVEDDLSGPFETAQILFRLVPGSYRKEGNRIIAPWGVIEIAASDCSISMGNGFESLYYWEKKPVNVLTIKVDKNCRKITTNFFLSNHLTT